MPWLCDNSAQHQQQHGALFLVSPITLLTTAAAAAAAAGFDIDAAGTAGVRP
jgi:hypothetical protein